MLVQTAGSPDGTVSALLEMTIAVDSNIFKFQPTLSIKVVRLLIKAGCNINAKNIWGDTALDIAIQRENKAAVEILRSIDRFTEQ